MYALAGPWATYAAPAEPPHHRPPPHALPFHPCSSSLAGVRAGPQGVAPITHPSARRANPVVAYGRTDDSLAPSFLVMRGPDGGPLFAASR